MNAATKNVTELELSSPTILVVDDDPMNLGIVFDHLTDSGFKILVAQDGESALERVRYARPDLILLDVMMPEMDGFETCRRLKADEALQDIPVIFMTALTETQDKVKGFRLGAVDYITKPLQCEEVVARVTTHLRIQGLTRELREANESLERRVEERTAELAQANKELQAEIVERKRVEEALRESEERYRRLVEHAPLGILSADLQGNITAVNSALLTMLGSSSAKATQPINLFSFPPLIQSGIAGDVRQCLESGDTVVSERLYTSKWAKTAYVRLHLTPICGSNGRVTLVQLIAEDITERKQAEKEIHRRNCELALLNRVIAATTSTLNVEQVLQVACRELALTFELPQVAAALLNAEGTGINVVAEYLAPGRPSGLNTVIPVAGNPAVEYMLEQRAPVVVTNAQTDERLAPVHDLMRERGTVSLLIVPLTARGEVVGTIELDALEQREFDEREIALAQNVAAAAGQALETAQLYQALQRHAAELARALEQQQELDRLKSEFIQNVSHELRTPLALAQGYAELLASGELGELQPDQREPVAVITRRLQMLSRLVDDINAILEAETQALQRRPVDLADLVHTMLADSQIRAVAEKNELILEEDVPADFPPLFGDPGLLGRMLDNLLDNALKFTPAGGRIVVHLRQEGTEVVLQVADTGIGIPADQLERIFERFYQVDGSTARRYGGTGLGLALVKKIAEEHGGRVTVESQVGQGSTFTVWLPLGSEHQQDVK